MQPIIGHAAAVQPITGHTVVASFNDDSHNLSANMIAGVTVPYVAALVCVASRFWSRRLNKASVGWDDYLIVMALLICTTLYGLMWWCEYTCGSDTA